MTASPDNPFETIESGHRYVGLLAEALEEARNEIEEDIEAANVEGAERRMQALQLVRLKLNQLTQHLVASRRLLNDLRTLRRMLLGERQGDNEAEHVGTEVLD